LVKINFYTEKLERPVKTLILIARGGIPQLVMNWFRRKKKDPEPDQEVNGVEPGVTTESESAPVEVEIPATEEAAGFAEESPGELAVANEITGGAEDVLAPEQETAGLEDDQGLWDDAEDDRELWDEPWSGGERETEAAEQESGLEKGQFFRRLRDRLQKTRENFVDRVDQIVLGRKTIDADILDDLEEVLITSDLGVKTTQLLLRKVAEKIKRQELKDAEKLRETLREEILNILSVANEPMDVRVQKPYVIMVIGVNGVGKTTTVGKLAHRFKNEGLETLLVAGDTFRAAAVEQLTLWGQRAGVHVIHQKSGSDPSAVAFDGMDAAVSRKADVVLLDTAGRMHTKVNLMEELKKVQRIISRKMESAPHEILLVLDASTGQNALSQARLFKEQIGLTGLILTKLDGTAKGGIVVAICDELQVPVRYIGIGEQLDDLRPFDPEEFTRALF
jgi:fused signal recognition particle receptor